MYDSYYSTLRSYISMQPVQTDAPLVITYNQGVIQTCVPREF